MPRKFLLALMTLLIPAQWTFEGTAQADAVEFTLKAKMLAGQKETPHLILRINERLESLKVTLTREDGVTFDKSYVRVEAGGETRIDLPVVRGKNHHFKAAFDIGMDGETLHHETEFDAELITAPEFKVRNEDVNVDGGFLSLTSSRDIARIDVTVTNDEGKTVAKKSQRYGVAPSGSQVELLWGPTEGRVFRIDLTIYDTDEFHYGLSLFPWRYEIPHDEVNFATGSSDIAPAERPKLDASLKVLKEVLRRMGRSANLRLFIAGATDTVGDAASNQKLSMARAKSIGRYFRSKGVRIPIFAAGLGENGLKVATADEVDEVQNRRADYIVSVEEPVFSGGVPPVTWQKIP